MKTGLKVVAAAMLLFNASAWAGPLEEVAEAAAKWAPSYAEGNLDAFMAPFADNAAYTSALAAFRSEGKGAIRALFATLFHRYPQRQALTRHIERRAYGDDLVVANAYQDQTYTDKNGNVVTSAVRATAVWARIGGKWQIVDTHVSKVPH